jgi:hypothetical protein
MPLINSKSNRARAANIKTEIAAGKPVKQTVAISYAKQRAAAVHVTRPPMGEGHPTLAEVKEARRKKSSG